MTIFRCEPLLVVVALHLLGACHFPPRAEETLRAGPIAELIRANVTADDLGAKLAHYAEKHELRDTALRQELSRAGFEEVDRSGGCQFLAVSTPNNHWVKGGSTEITAKMCGAGGEVEFDVKNFGAPQ